MENSVNTERSEPPSTQGFVAAEDFTEFRREVMERVESLFADFSSQAAEIQRERPAAATDLSALSNVLRDAPRSEIRFRPFWKSAPAMWFSTLEEQFANRNITSENDKYLNTIYGPKTAVITPFGLYEYTVMTFGLRNAAQTFQRYVDSALRDLDFTFVYLDDILVSSTSVEEHKVQLEIVFRRLQEHSLQLNLDKCEIGRDQVDFLGYRVSSEGYKPLDNKVRALIEYPKPANIEELRRFLGVLNFYRSSIPHAAEMQSHLNKYLKDSRKKDKRPVEWDNDANDAFERCRQSLVEVVSLAYPHSNAQIRVVTDASDVAMGAALEQQVNNTWQPLSFFSRKFNQAQTAYSTFDRELTAICEAIKYFSYYLEGRSFVVATDHKPLIFAHSQSQGSAPPRRLRQMIFLAQYDITYQHLPGSANDVADALSRIVVEPEIFDNVLNLDSISLPSLFDLERLASLQSSDTELPM
ncbi:unnamed protein product [Trichogramma brassicae]|uniref:RNA-directed DNA polymerase n=1 Tax=Trichogramma brassicae TaxID=86971 RepID=A0A6H5I0C4_9HYME|nr:unnamed protein product [Trichogramma brassicae]